MNQKKVFWVLSLLFLHFIVQAQKDSISILQNLQELNQRIQNKDMKVINDLDALLSKKWITDNTVWEGRVLKLKGDYFAAQQHYEQAEKWYLKSLDKLDVTSDSLTISYLYFQLAKKAYYKDYQSATIFFVHKALNVLPNIAISKRIDYYILLGKAQMQIHDFFAANNALNTALELARNSNDEAKKLLVTIYGLQSKLLADQAVSKKEVDGYRDQVMNQDDVRIKALYFQVSGLSKSTMEAALKEFRVSDVFLEPDMLELYVQNLFYKADIALKTKNYESALELVTSAQDSYLKSSYFNREKTANALLNTIYRKQGDIEQANLYFSKIMGHEQDELDYVSNLLLKDKPNNQSIQNFEKSTTPYYIGYILLVTVLLVVLVILYRLRRRSKVQQKLNKLLEKSNESLKNNISGNNRFVNDITYELRTPLMIIKYLSQLLQQSRDSAKSEMYLGLLQFTNIFLARYVKYISFAKKVQKDIVTEEIFDLKSLLTNIGSIYQVYSKDEKLSVKIDERLPVSVQGDALRFCQVMLSIVRLGDLDQCEGNQFIARMLINNPHKVMVGLCFKTQKHIFNEQILDEFYQNKKSDLQLVSNMQYLRQRVELLKGEMLARSRVQGDEIEIKVSFKKVFNAEKVKENNKLIQEEPPSDHANKFHVLLVEDNKINQMIMQKLIRSRGYICDTANHGREAIEMVQAKKYGLVLMDIMMPVMNGIEATKTIRSFDQRTPIVALSAVSKGSMIKDLEGLNVSMLVNKPIEPAELFQIIEQYATKNMPFSA